MKNKCLECGEVGQPVSTVTLRLMVRPNFLEVAGKPGFCFCRSPDCDVVYFHPDGELLRKVDLRVRVGMKETEDPLPLCYCFGFTKAMAIEEIQTTGGCTIPARIAAKVRAGNCACETRNPQGTCCLGQVSAVIKRLVNFPAPNQPVPLMGSILRHADKP